MFGSSLETPRALLVACSSESRHVLLQDLPFKVAIAAGILGLGYAIIAALAAIRAVVRRHADLVLGPVRE